MDREQLERPFHESLVKTRKGPFGQTLSYVEGCEYIRRLNEALGGNWSFEVIDHQVREGVAVVLGKLSSNGVSKMAFGGSAITVSREGEVVNIADDLKAAATDALKKASSLLGVGLHLYGDGSRQAAENGTGTNGNGHRRSPARPSNGNGNGHPDRCTQRQLTAIWSMARRLGQSSDQVREQTISVFGTQPEHLTKTDASQLITELGEALGSPNGRS